MQDKSGIRSFIVLMDKNKDTQWLEDGVFVPNPLAEFNTQNSSFDNSSTAQMFGTITGIPFVKEVTGTIIQEGMTRYVVKGYRYASDNSNQLIQRVVTVNY